MAVTLEDLCFQSRCLEILVTLGSAARRAAGVGGVQEGCRYDDI